MRPIHEDQNTPERLSDHPGAAFLDFCHPMVILTAGWLSGKRSGHSAQGSGIGDMVAGRLI